MKQGFLILLSLLVLPFGLFAQDDSLEAEHDELRKLKVIFEEAVNKNELDKLKPHISENFSYVTISDEEYTDFEEFKKEWQIGREKLLEGGSYTLTMDPELSDIRGDIAICRGDSKNVIITGSGDRYEYTAKWTCVCVKENGEWKLLRAHSSINPFDNEILVSKVKSTLIKYASISALVGIVLGWLFCMFIMKRRKTES